MFIKLAANLLADMVYPNVCCVCGNWLVQGEQKICLHCLDLLPRTHLGLNSNNPIAKLFWGKVQLSFAGSYLYFHRQGMVQNILHRMKYRGEKEIAFDLGGLYAQELRLKNPEFRPDFLIPVPLHPRKLRQRGYNQSHIIAKAMGEILNAEVRTDFITRRLYSNTQTKRGRFERWQNVDGLFTVGNCDILNDKLVVLVDDVITTGATLEACIKPLNNASNCRVGVLSLAVAKN